MSTDTALAIEGGLLPPGAKDIEKEDEFYNSHAENKSFPPELAPVSLLVYLGISVASKEVLFHT
jgi:hypothetical protein